MSGNLKAICVLRTRGVDSNFCFAWPTAAKVYPKTATRRVPNSQWLKCRQGSVPPRKLMHLPQSDPHKTSRSLFSSVGLIIEDDVSFALRCPHGRPWGWSGGLVLYSPVKQCVPKVTSKRNQYLEINSTIGFTLGKPEKFSLHVHPGRACGNQDYCRSVPMVGATQVWCTNKDDLSLNNAPRSIRQRTTSSSSPSDPLLEK